MNLSKKTVKMNEVSLFRLYLLRALYLFIVVGIAIFRWPEVIQQVIYQEKYWELMKGVVVSCCSPFRLCQSWGCVSVADASFATVGIGVEVDLADRRCAPTVVSRSNGRSNLGDDLELLDSRDCSFHHSLALCV